MPESVVECVDNIEFMQRFPDKFFDLAVVDPPYGINSTKMNMGSHPKRSRTDGYGSGPGVTTAVKLRKRLNGGAGKLKNRILNSSNIDWDNDIPPQVYFDELFRVSKHQVIWGGNYFPLPPTRGIAVWNKLQPWDNFSQCELAWTSFDTPAKLLSLSNTGGSNQEAKIHPTQKPVKLYHWIYKHYAQPGFKILDTHMGSQSSRIAAYDMGFDYWGCDKNMTHFQDGNNRFEKHISQLSIFNR